MKTSTRELLDSAARVFHGNGFHETRVSDIVADAGVSQGTFYLYFDSKKDAFLSVLRDFTNEIGVLLLGVDWDAIDTADDYQAHFSELYERLFELCARDRPAADLLVNQAPALGGKPAQMFDEVIDQAENITEQYLAEGIKRGFLRELDAKAIARSAVGLVLHTANRTIIRDGRTEDLDELARQLVDFELWGAGIHPSEQPRSADTTAEDLIVDRDP